MPEIRPPELFHLWIKFPWILALIQEVPFGAIIIRAMGGRCTWREVWNLDLMDRRLLPGSLSGDNVKNAGDCVRAGDWLLIDGQQFYCHLIVAGFHSWEKQGPIDNTGTC